MRIKDISPKRSTRILSVFVLVGIARQEIRRVSITDEIKSRIDIVNYVQQFVIIRASIELQSQEMQ